MRPSSIEVRDALDRAVNRLIHNDHHLLHADCSERSITHQLAVYLAAEFPGYNVDCEYNRDGFDIKRLKLGVHVAAVTADELDAVTVFPDVIVHRRGTNDSNLLVIELKKPVARPDLELFDTRKLQAFQAELRYAHAALIVLGFTKNQELVRKVEWQ